MFKAGDKVKYVTTGPLGWESQDWARGAGLVKGGVYTVRSARYDRYEPSVQIEEGRLDHYIHPDHFVLAEEGTKEMNMSVAEAYKVMQSNCGIEVGDTVKVLRKAEDGEMGWFNSFTPRMGRSIGKEFKVIGIEGTGIVVRIDDVRCGFPFFVLELVKKGKKLPEPIRISSQYKCEFKEDGSIAVGCQSLNFDLIEKIYMTAKGLKGKE